MPYFTNSDEDQDDTFEIIEEVTKKTKYDFDLESGFYEVKKEKDIILDAFALLGGNENLVSQILDKLEATNYTSTEEDVIRNVARRLWFGDNQSQNLCLPSPLTQANLIQQMTPLNQDRIHRLLARALLYSGSYSDTQVFGSTLNPSYYTIVISMAHVAGADLPLGHTPSEGVACHKLAILFHWASSKTNKWHQDNVNRSSGRVRTISTSLELELKMLSITDMFAIIICP